MKIKYKIYIGWSRSVHEHMYDILDLDLNVEVFLSVATAAVMVKYLNFLIF